MKYFLTIMVFLFIFFVPACSEQQVEGFALRFEKEKIDFGDKEEGIKVNISYKVKNIGTEVLKILDVRPTCGCTVLDDWDHEIQPGQWGEIPVTFDTTHYAGDIYKTVNVDTNVPGKETIILTIEGHVVTYIELSPPSLWFGQVNRDDPAKAGSIIVKSTYKEPLNVTGIENNYDNVTSNYRVIEEGKIFEVNISIQPPFASGHQNLKINLLTDRKDKPSISLPVAYYMQPDLEVVPLYIQISENQLTPGVDRNITIKDNSGKAISIKSVKSLGANIKFTIEERAPGSLYQVFMKLDTSNVSIDVDTKILLEVNTANGVENFEIPILIMPSN
ncbi:MAG: DUF1573 domain-containing protein [Spirochaetales bacterium]|nr:DUF1573 domain-containing protein [Spirochaetales bacterium]